MGHDPWATRVGANPRAVIPADRLIDSVADFLDFEPGTRWAYSNTNYLLLGAIVERIEGRPRSQRFSASDCFGRSA